LLPLAEQENFAKLKVVSLSWRSIQVLAALAQTESHWIWNALGLLSIPLLVGLNGLFVAAEFALVAVRRTRIEELVLRGVRGARAAESALVHLDRSIAATQLGITLASIGLGWAGEPALASLLEPLFATLPGGWHIAALHSVAAGLAFVLIAFLHVVFGELLPKALAIQTADRSSLWLAGPLAVFARLTRPLILLMSGTSNLLLRCLGFRPAGSSVLVHSVEELALLVEDMEEAGVLEPEQAEAVQNAFRFSSKRVGDCLVPRDKMATLELRTPPEKVLEAVRNGAHTRMPVYEGQLDNIVGIVNTKDLFYLFSLQGVVILEDALYPALFLKPESDLGDALNLFRRAHRHMAVVRDDEGKVHGLITLEDILEEIVGDIEDEHDRPNPRLQRWRGQMAPRPPATPALPAPANSSPIRK
jgi:CBS domain containing-hemolysin-like protein